MSALSDLIDVLVCPVCGDGFIASEPALRCRRGHSFDIARQGYVNLLNGPRPAHADTSEMVAARGRFLAGGWFDPVIDALQQHCPSTGFLLDVGAGPGWYASQLLDRHPALRGLALDISVPAVRIAARSHDRLAAVVADTWQHLPVADHGADAVLCVFAPRNLDEFRRVLAPGGRLLIVTPGEDHLVELRTSGSMLRIQPDKLGELDRRLQPAFGVSTRNAIVTHVALRSEQVADLLGMGPNAFHESTRAPTRLPQTVTLSVDLTVADARP